MTASVWIASVSVRGLLVTGVLAALLGNADALSHCPPLNQTNCWLSAEITCSKGTHQENGGGCVKNAPTCAAGQHWDSGLQSCVGTCPPGKHWAGAGCVPNCPAGKHWTASMGCVPNCPAGKHWDGGFQSCIPTCPPPKYWDGKNCVDYSQTCPPNKFWDGKRCVGLPSSPARKPRAVQP